MTLWYRASHDENPQITFSGIGGLYVAGRWNYLGKRVVYCSESIALCTLEWLANNGLSASDFNYYRYEIAIPDHLIKRFTPKELPKTWNAVPATDSCREFAQVHLFASSKTLALAIPSVIVPEEYNLVIDPTHPGFEKIVATIKVLGQHKAPKR